MCWLCWTSSCTHVLLVDNRQIVIPSSMSLSSIEAWGGVENGVGAHSAVEELSLAPSQGPIRPSIRGRPSVVTWEHDHQIVKQTLVIQVLIDFFDVLIHCIHHVCKSPFHGFCLISTRFLLFLIYCTYGASQSINFEFNNYAYRNRLVVCTS